MQLILSHDSAIEFWSKWGDLCCVRQFKVPNRFPLKMRDGEGADYGLSFPLNVLVSNKTESRANLNCHICSNLPMSQCVYRIATPKSPDSTLCVCSPEFAFVQLSAAHSRSDIELIALAYQLCSRYSLDPKRPNGLRPHEPFTSVNAMRAFATANPKLPGSKRALRLLQYVADGSRSPMETRAAMVFSLPRYLGGYALKGLTLNARVPLTDVAESMLRRNYCEIDLYFPEIRLGVEYDSTQHHAGGLELVRDARRKEALRLCNIELTTMTADLFSSLDWVDALAVRIAKKQGIRWRCSIEDFPARQLELRQALVNLSELPAAC